MLHQNKSVCKVGPGGGGASADCGRGFNGPILLRIDLKVVFYFEGILSPGSEESLSSPARLDSERELKHRDRPLMMSQGEISSSCGAHC